MSFSTSKCWVNEDFSSSSVPSRSTLPPRVKELKCPFSAKLSVHIFFIFICVSPSPTFIRCVCVWKWANTKYPPGGAEMIWKVGGRRHIKALKHGYQTCVETYYWNLTFWGCIHEKNILLTKWLRNWSWLMRGINLIQSLLYFMVKALPSKMRKQGRKIVFIYIKNVIFLTFYFNVSSNLFLN